MNLIPVWVLDGQATNALDRNGRWSLLAAAVLCVLVFQETVFLFVAAGFTWRLFTNDLPRVSSPRTVAYFICILGFLGVVLRTVPGYGFSRSCPPYANFSQNETLSPFSTLLLCTNNSGGKTLHELSVG